MYETPPTFLYARICTAVATVVKSGGMANALWDTYNGLMRLGDQSLRATLLFMAAGFFCRAITSSGSDMENLMAALGGKGLSAA